MNSEVHILVYCPIDTLQWGQTHSAMGRIEFKFTFYVWYRSEEISPNVNQEAMGDVLRVERDTRISLDVNENPLFTSSKISDKDISHSQ